MLIVCCDACGEKFVVKGYVSNLVNGEPDAVVTDLELIDDRDRLCGCLIWGETYYVVEGDSV